MQTDCSICLWSFAPHNVFYEFSMFSTSFIHTFVSLVNFFIFSCCSALYVFTLRSVYSSKRFKENRCDRRCHTISNENCEFVAFVESTYNAQTNEWKKLPKTSIFHPVYEFCCSALPEAQHQITNVSIVSDMMCSSYRIRLESSHPTYSSTFNHTLLQSITSRSERNLYPWAVIANPLLCSVRHTQWHCCSCQTGIRTQLIRH